MDNNFVFATRNINFNEQYQEREYTHTYMLSIIYSGIMIIKQAGNRVRWIIRAQGQGEAGQRPGESSLCS